MLAQHECPDGSGYPLGRKADEISKEARILRVADVFSSLLEERPYKAAMDVNGAMQILREWSGTKVDARAVQALEQLVDEGVPLL